MWEGSAQRTLVIHGARDELVPVGAAEYLAAHLRDARLETLAGAAHAPFLSEPDRVAERIADFLAMSDEDLLLDKRAGQARIRTRCGGL